MPDTQDNDSAAREAIGCVALLLLFAVCVVVPSSALHLFGPGVGIVAAVAAFFAWVRLGSSPFPGFLPGQLCMVVTINSFAWVVICIVDFLR